MKPQRLKLKALEFHLNLFIFGMKIQWEILPTAQLLEQAPNSSKTTLTDQEPNSGPDSDKSAEVKSLPSGQTSLPFESDNIIRNGSRSIGTPHSLETVKKP